jgi:MATE family multidrug resistance protein
VVIPPPAMFILFLSMNKEILRLAVPNIISNISVPLLSTVDTALMGQLSAAHIGAVGLGSMIFNFIYWNFGFLRMGTTGITAQAYGRKDKQAIIHTMGRSALIAVIIGLLIILLQWPLTQAGNFLMQVQPDQQDMVNQYLYIRIWAAPATLGLYAFMGWFFGMQNAAFPLIITVFGNVLNIVLSFVLVYSFNMEIAGVALGTLVAQYLSLGLAIFLFWLKYRSYMEHLILKALFKWEELQSFLSINADIFLRTFLLTLSFGFFYSKSSAGGEMVLAANVILLQFVNWMSYGIDGFAFASESLVGKYTGARDEAKTRQAIRLSFVWGMALALAYSLTYLLFGDPILRIFTNEAEVIEVASSYMIWLAIFPVAGTPCYIWDGIYIGLTASRSMRNMMILSIIVYFLMYYTVGIPWGNHGLWLSLTVFMLARGIFLHIQFARKGIFALN